MSQVFKKVKEDFVCGHCGAEVVGNGYTNHCPKCLWSRHVDINPGDRGEECGGLMRPESVELQGGEYIITHICVDCRAARRVRAAREDDISGFLTGVV
jgi:Zn finger protein HypA/HybF involved in hydrogenase expression